MTLSSISSGDSIFQGDDHVLAILLRKPNASNPTLADPFDVTSASAVDVRCKGASGTSVHFTLTASEVALTTPLGGLITVTMSPAKTALLATGTGMPLDVVLTDSAGKVWTFEILQALTVLPRQVTA